MYFFKLQSAPHQRVLSAKSGTERDRGARTVNEKTRRRPFLFSFSLRIMEVEEFDSLFLDSSIFAQSIGKEPSKGTREVDTYV